MKIRYLCSISLCVFAPLVRRKLRKTFDHVWPHSLPAHKYKLWHPLAFPDQYNYIVHGVKSPAKYLMCSPLNNQDGGEEKFMPSASTGGLFNLRER